jgi:hypothetical protein
MILNMYAVRDSAVEAFLQPFFSPTHGAAIRSLTEAVNDPAHAFHKNAKYYALYHLAGFDDASGVVHPNEALKPEFLIDCLNLLNKD